MSVNVYVCVCVCSVYVCVCQSAVGKYNEFAQVDSKQLRVFQRTL